MYSWGLFDAPGLFFIIVLLAAASHAHPVEVRAPNANGLGIASAKPNVVGRPAASVSNVKTKTAPTSTVPVAAPSESDGTLDLLMDLTPELSSFDATSTPSAATPASSSTKTGVGASAAGTAILASSSTKTGVGASAAGTAARATAKLATASPAVKSTPVKAVKPSPLKAVKPLTKGKSS